MFCLVRRKKIRIPIKAAKTAMGRKAQSAYVVISRTRGRKTSSDSEELSMSKKGEQQLSDEDHLPMRVSFRDETYFGKNKKTVTTNGEVYPTIERSHYSLQHVEARSSGIKILDKQMSFNRVNDETLSRIFSFNSLQTKIPDLEFCKYELPLRYPTSSFLKIRGINIHL